MVGRDHRPGKDRLTEGGQDIRRDAFARTGAEGHAIGQKLLLQISGHATAAVCTKHRLHLGQQAFQGFGRSKIALAPGNCHGTVTRAEFVERRLLHLGQCAGRKAPVFLTLRARALFQLRIGAQHGIAHPLGRAPGNVEGALDIGDGNPFRRALDHEGQLQQVFLT